MTPRAWLALWAVYIVWGSTYLAIRVVVETIPPLLAAGTRWVVAGGILFALAARSGWERPTWRQVRASTIVGIALLLGGNGLVSVAERRISSGMAALLVATVPLFVALFEWMTARVRPRPVIVAGMALGFAGTAVLVRPQSGSGSVDIVGAFTVLAAAATWAAGSLYARNADLPARPITSTALQMVCGGVAIFIVASVGGEWSRLDTDHVSRASLLGVLYLIVFGSLVGFTSYAWLIRNARTSVVTTYAYVNPLVAVFLGTLILDEAITVTTLAGGAIIIAAVALIVVASSSKKVEYAERGPSVEASLP